MEKWMFICDLYMIITWDAWMRNEIEKYWDFDIGVWGEWIWLLEVFFTGSEELFSPFIAGTLSDFL